MAAPTTPAEVFDLLRQSGLVAESEMARCKELANEAMTAEQFVEELVRRGLVTPFHTSNLLKGRWRGFFVGKYRLLELLGVGGMGQVYLAAHETMRRLVAIKLLTLRPGADPSILPRFQREARAMAALDHPHIVKAFDADKDDKIHYIVLEYVDGLSLNDLVRQRGTLTLDRAANYICQAAIGLHHAHQMGVIHRDIKPGNMLIDRDGLVKILDMGLARLYHDSADNLTLEHNAGQALGTADYLAPEQATNSHDVEPRADIYALGCTFYFLLTGRAPFQGASISQKLAWHQTRMPASVRQSRPDVPVEVEAILNKMMAKKPQDRFATAEEVREVLEPWAGPLLPPEEHELPQHCPAVHQMVLPNLPRETFVHRDQAKRPTGKVPRVQMNAATLTPPPAASPPAPTPAPAPQPPPTPPGGARPRSGEVRRVADTPPAGNQISTDTERTPRGQTRSVARPATPAPTMADQSFAAYLPQAPKKNAEGTWLRRWWATMLVVSMLVVGGVAGAVSSLATRMMERDLPTLPASEAGNHVNQRRTVELQVRSVVAVKNGSPVIYLHSEADWKQRDNFSVVLTNAAIQRYREDGVEDLVQYFKDRTIRVTGTIQQQKDRNLKFQRVQTVIDDPASVRSVEE
jgi:eukaryotic-like serine/threonine-protein kinase